MELKLEQSKIDPINIVVEIKFELHCKGAYEFYTRLINDLRFKKFHQPQ